MALSFFTHRQLNERFMLELLPEWHPQWGVLLVWPSYIHTLPAVEQNYAIIVAAILAEEPVLLVCDSEEQRVRITKLLRSHSANIAAIHWHIAPSSVTQTKEIAPLAARHYHELSLHIFEAKQTLQQVHWQLPVQTHSDLILAAGAVCSDGRGNMITAEPHLLALNPNLDKQSIEQHIRGKFGTRRIWWLKHGDLSPHEPTNVTKLVRFCNPHTLSYSQSTDSKGDYYDTLTKMQRELFNIASGQSIDLVPLPLPLARYGTNGERLPASYTHFLILEKSVLVPAYGCVRDESALQQLAHAMPNYSVKPIDCSALLEHGIDLSSIAQPLPEGVL